MKKVCILALASALAISGAALAGCGGDETIETAGESTRLSTNKDPSELDAYNVAYAFIDKQDKLTSYELSTTGETVAKKGIITYTQKIENTHIKHGDEYFQQSVSSSSLVNMSHQVFVKGENAAYRNATSGDISTATKAEYKSVYGVSPDDSAIGGYIFNAETITYAELASDNGDGTLTYRYVLDGETAGANAKLQMKEFGGLSGYPEFSSLTLLLTINEDWTPVSISTTAEYTITKSVLGEMSCTQNLTSVYSNVNGDVTIPDTEAFNAAVGSTSSQVTGAQGASSTYMQIAETFASYDWATGRTFDLNVALTAAAGESKVSCEIPVTMYAKYNEDASSVLDTINFGLTADLSNFTLTPTLVTALNSELYGVCDNISEAKLYYIGDGNLYVTLSGGGVVYLVDYVDLTSVLGDMLGYVDIGSVSEMDVDSIFTVLNTLFEDDGGTLTLNSALADAVGSGFGLSITTDLTASAASVTLNTGLTISDMDIKLTASLKDGGALKASALESDVKALNSALADDEKAAIVRDAISSLSSAKQYGESYYSSAVKSARGQYDALTDGQKALVINYNLLPDENGGVSGALLAALGGFADIDYLTGVCMSVDLNIGLLANLGLDGYAYGDLYFKYNADALAEGNLLNLVNFRLDVDLTNYYGLLYMIQAYAADAMPFDAALLSLTNASIYYTGDGNIYVALKTGSVVMYFDSINVAALLAQADYSDMSVSFAELLPLLVDVSDPVAAFKVLEEQMFTETDTINGTEIYLNESYVEALASMYESLVESVVDSTSSMGSMVSYIVESILNCDITEVTLTVDNAGVFKGVSLVVGGNIVVYGEEVVPVLGIEITVDGVLTDEMDGDSEELDELSANAQKATVVFNAIQNLIDNVQIGDDYLAAVAEAETAYEALTDEQKAYVTNATITVNYVSTSIFDYLESRHEALKAAADSLLEGFDKDGKFGTDFTDGDWTEYNAYYDAIKDYGGVLAYVTDEKVQTYIAARYNYEKPTATAMMTEIAKLQSDYAAGTVTLQDALEAYYGEYKDLYETFGDEIKEEIDDDYNAFVVWVIGENYRGVTAAINDAMDEMNALIAKGADNVTYEELVAVYQEYAAATAWYTGSDYYTAYLNGLSTLQFSYVNWMNDTCPAELAEEYAEATAAYSAIYSLTNGSTGAFVTGFASEIVLKEYADKSYPTSTAEAQEADLSSLSLELAQKLYENVSVMYYITNRGGSSLTNAYIITGSDGATYRAYLVLNNYRTTIANYIVSLQSAE